MKNIHLSLLLATSVMVTACQTPALKPETATIAKPVSVVVGPERCESLAGTKIGSAIIERAEMIKRGTETLGFFKRVFIKTFIWPGFPDLRMPVDICQVTAKLRPESGSEITTQVWLPMQWNGKLFGTGGGGFNGGLDAAPLTLSEQVGKGYVAMATDVGHETASSATFAHDSPQQYVDYAYRGNHLSAEFSKALAATYYGSAVKRAYFQGCSNGGRDALMEAKRFPDDYDGIIAGAPAAGWSKLMTFFAWNTQAVESAPKLGRKLKLLQNAVLAKCDALDGVKDNLIENPQNCHFDPAELQCKNGDDKDCLNAAEVAALHKIYGGPQLSNGTKIYPGLSVGGEGLRRNWEEWVVRGNDMQKMFAEQSFRWMVYGDPKWNVGRFDIDRDYPLAHERMGPIMDSDTLNLTDFTGKGGKLMLYHGWNDAAIPAEATVNYFTALTKTLGPVADAQVRLFMVPGMMHCGAGVGPTAFDAVDQMDHWVETGIAPEKMTATEYDPPAYLRPAPDAKIVRTRPLCPWPKVAHYNGNGSTDDAANFSCR